MVSEVVLMCDNDGGSGDGSGGVGDVFLLGWW